MRTALAIFGRWGRATEACSRSSARKDEGSLPRSPKGVASPSAPRQAAQETDTMSLVQLALAKGKESQEGQKLRVLGRVVQSSG